MSVSESNEVQRILEIKGPNFLIIVKGHIKEDYDGFIMVAKDKEDYDGFMMVQPLLSKIYYVVPKEMLDGLPPMRDIQHNIDFVPGASYPNLPHYRMRSKEYEILQK